MKIKDQIKFNYLIVFSLEDIALAWKLNFLSVVINENYKYINQSSPDFYINDISDLRVIDSKLENKIMFYEINIARCPYLKELNSIERLLLQSHFRRIQQHSLVMGRFMYLQAKLLNQNSKDWEIAGVLHDIDYARAYFDMNHHGSLSLSILKNYKVNKKIMEAIRYHTKSKFCRTKFLLGWSLHISEMFTKRFVHTIRRFNYSKISEVKFSDFMKVYDNEDFRKNERLTHLDKPPMPYSSFKKMMAAYDRDIDYYPIPRKKLFTLVKQSFEDLNIFPLNITHKKELANLRLNNK